MCGRMKGADATWAEFHDMLSGFASFPPERAERYAGREIFPTNQYPIIVKAGDNAEVIEARWWLVPFFHKAPVKDWKATTFNAKIEEAADKASFRGPWKSKHCLVHVSRFWEWKLNNPEAQKSKQTKSRFNIGRSDNHSLVFAGLWDRATTADGEVTSFTVLTRKPGPEMAELHTREPVILDPEQWQPWLDCAPMPELVEPSRAGLVRYAPETAFG